MAIVILFGGGDGGGIRITPRGVEPIPPWDPAVRLQLKALGQLVRAQQLMSGSARQPLLRETLDQLTSTVLTQVEQVVGELDGETGLIFQDHDGGFVCGSTGKPAIPFPWPVDPRRTVQGYFEQGVLDRETLSFLEKAARHNLDVFAVAEDPKAAAQRIGASLSPSVEQRMAGLRPQLLETGDSVTQEVVGFYRKVVTDGRFISDWVNSPEEVAGKLGLDVSRSAIERIIETRDSGAAGQLGGGDVAVNPVAIAIAIVIVLWTREVDLPVDDFSGVSKL